RRRRLVESRGVAARRTRGHRDLRVARHRTSHRGPPLLPRRERRPGLRVQHGRRRRARHGAPTGRGREGRRVRGGRRALPLRRRRVSLPHILVANAGVNGDKYPPLADTATADFDRVLAVNARGSFLCLREAANRLPRGGGGRIVAVTSSVVGSLPAGYSPYTASKAAVEA
ncbi:hypothetical protein CFC21_008906, partial [Triticum aestivum]